MTDNRAESSVRPHRDYLDSRQATEYLGIQRATLYAYVSRGYVRSVVSKGQRQRLYVWEDLERIRARVQSKAGHRAVAEAAMNLGQPIIPTRITEITATGPRYRGFLAIDLVQQGATFEQVAELLWTGIWHPQPPVWDVKFNETSLRYMTDRLPAAALPQQMLELYAWIILHLAMGRGAIENRLISGQPLQAGREMLFALAGCLGFLGPRMRYASIRTGSSFAQTTLRALGADTGPASERAMNAILVLMADHELSPGTLSARVAASSGASVHSCIAAAMAVSSGTEVALLYNSVSLYAEQEKSLNNLLANSGKRVIRGERVPGFDHPLYPKGDPRAQALLSIVKSLGRLRGKAARLVALADFMQEHHQLYPRHELALVALCESLQLHTSAAPALFALGRVSGWMAHVMEQRLSPTLIRPRAKFTGPVGSGS